MNEGKIKRQSYNQHAINALAKKYSVGKTMVRAALRGDRESETAQSIKKDYRALVAQMLKPVEEFIQQT